MGDTKYTELSLPLCSESSSKSTSRKTAAAKLIAGISGLVIFGYFMSATYSSTTKASALNLASSQAELPAQYQLELVSAPEKVSEFGKPNYSDSRAVLSKDNSLAAFVSYENKIEVWDVQKKELVATFIDGAQAYKVEELLFTPDSKYLISRVENSNLVELWDLESRSLYGQIEEERSFSSLFVTSDSKFVGYKTHEDVSFWEISSLNRSKSLKVRDDSYLNSIALTPDRKYLAMAISGAVNIIRVYDLSTRKKIATIEAESQPYNLNISDDGKIVGVEDYGNTTRFWKVETGELIAKIEYEGGAVKIGLSPNGRFAWIKGSYESILYDVEAKKILKEIDDYVYKCYFTKDSKYLLVSYYASIQVLDLETINEVTTLDYRAPIGYPYLSEDGEYLLVSTYKSADLWDLSNLKN